MAALTLAAATGSAARAADAVTAIAANADGAAAAAISSSPSAVDEVVVTGRRATTIQGAIDEKKNSLGVTEVMSAEEIAERPGADIVDVISHLPGLSAFSDMGLGQAATGQSEFVTIRGIDSSYNAYYINGIRAPQADPNSRALSLTMLPPEGLQSVKVYKTPGVDQDGDAIGGSIDFRTPTAFDFSGPLFRVSADSNYAQVADQTGARDLGGGGQIEFARKFTENLGLYATAYYDAGNSAGEAVESLGYTPTLASEATQTNYAALKGGLSGTGVRFDYYRDDIQRYGGNFSLDYKRENQQFYVQGSYSKYQVDGEDTQHAIDTGIISLYGNGQTYSPVGLIPGSYFQQRNQDEQLVTAKVGGESTFDRLTADYSVSYAYSSMADPNNVSGSLYGPYSATGSAPVIDMSDPAHVNVVYNSAASRAYVLNQDSDALWKYQGNESASYDTIYTGKVDLNYRVEQGVLDDIKGGVDVNVANRIQYNHYFFGGPGNTNGNFVVLGPGGVVVPLEDPQGAPVSQVPGRNLSSFLGGDYPGVFRVYTPQLFQQGTLPYKYTSQFGIDPTTGKVTGNPGPYTINDYNGQTVTGTEAVYAGYLQTDMHWRDVVATAGVRYENVNFSSRQWQVEGDTGGFVSSSHNYGEVLPSLILTYRPDDWMVFRGAVRESYSRPAFGLIASPRTTSVNDFTGQIASITEGNPNLKPSTATNYDASAEFYGPHASLFTIDAYYKQIEDFIYAATVTGAPPSANVATNNNGGVVTSVPENGKDANLEGMEMDARKQFTELQGPLGGFGLGGSVTWQHSSADSGRADHFGRRTWLPRAPELIYNLDLFYKMYGVSTDLAYHYEGLQLVGLTSNNLDEYLQPVKSLDFSASYPIHGVTFTVAAKNLLDNVEFYKTLGKGTQYLGTQDGGGNGSYVETGRFLTFRASYTW